MIFLTHQSASRRSSSNTFIPSSQETHRSPLVRKQATACLARWWIQPSSLSWVITASTQGNPVRPLAHLARACVGLKTRSSWIKDCCLVQVEFSKEIEVCRTFKGSGFPGFRAISTL